MLLPEFIHRARAKVAAVSLVLLAASAHSRADDAGKPLLVIHGGAGVIAKTVTPERERAVRTELERALRKGYAVLAGGGSSLDAVGAAISTMEDSGTFNAGKGAVFNHDGKNELDAAIMDGATLRAGSVANVHTVKNPILLARAVMDKSPHVMLVGEGAEIFAKSVGMKPVPPKYFFTEMRWKELQEALKEEKSGHHGTVGAVAMDRAGHLAAGTSTGGITNKRYGRVGDSPIIGAGTYADAHCAVSATGWGEFYIRATAAKDICARMEYAHTPLAEAASTVVMDIVPKLGGDGGVIAIDDEGDIAMPFNTEGMFRGTIDVEGRVRILIFKDR
ncbi:MAG TPA: isoaspartyl peptidase/L-asparaginase [Rhodanobacteraceae bacterium]|nr:isoaspartyl peptidase/L-asparaginase [Rhodanobacteraceae bacterium]